VVVMFWLSTVLHAVTPMAVYGRLCNYFEHALLKPFEIALYWELRQVQSCSLHACTYRLSSFCTPQEWPPTYTHLSNPNLNFLAKTRHQSTFYHDHYDHRHHHWQGRAPIVVASLAKTWKPNGGLSAEALSNDVGFRACLMPSANTVSNASALAKVGACVANGGSLGDTRLLSSEGVKKALQTTKPVFDESMGRLLTYTDCGKFRTPDNYLDTDPPNNLASFGYIQ
jgi:hypothetical protein